MNNYNTSVRSETFRSESEEGSACHTGFPHRTHKVWVQEPQDNSKHMPSLSLQSEVVKSDALAAFQR